MRITKSSQEKNKKKNFKKVLQRAKRKIKGITLIALVVTIIVLLILAGVALSLTVGNNGLFRRAENAANTWQMAEQNEQIEMEKASNFIEDYMNGNGGSGNNTQGVGSETGGETTTVGDLKPGDGEEVIILDETTEVEDGLENKVVIPGGFGIASDSGTNVEDGIVIEDEDGNQFVWVPVSVLNEETGEKTPIHTNTGDITIDYTRISYCGENITTEYTETMATDEMESINDNGGYYIGRYEAGDGSSTDFRPSATDGTVVIKKNQIPYNRISRETAETKATEMATVQEYTTAKTKLVSSYAWDTALDFIQKANSDNEYSDYATSSSGYSSTIIRTGQTTAVSNIYDMGGNVSELSTENRSDGDYRYVYRGGNNYSTGTRYPAGKRFGSDFADFYRVERGFRVTLYCSTES